jgi:hypothetical protein
MKNSIFFAATVSGMSFTFAMATASPNTSHSFERTPAFNEVERCRVLADPFAIPAYVPGLLPGEGRNGPIKNTTLKPSDTGHCVDQKDYRPVLFLTPEESNGYALPQQIGRVSVANVRGLQGWYTASIPTTSAAYANFMVAIRRMPVLGVRGGHAELRIFFTEPVVLTPQWPKNSSKAFQTHELIFTTNPTGFDGPSRYDTVKNFDGSLLNARGIHTREIRIKQGFIDSHAFTEKQYRLNLEPWELSNYITHYIDVANKKRLSQRFILTVRNCDSTQFEILDAVLSHRYNIFQMPFDPEFARHRLRERNLISETGEVLPFEMEPFAQKMFETYGRAQEH